eukprot:COSAG01_NODE_3246_length_6357_cov_4.131831_10_plen_51_part_00
METARQVVGQRVRGEALAVFKARMASDEDGEPWSWPTEGARLERRYRRDG